MRRTPGVLAAGLTAAAVCAALVAPSGSASATPDKPSRTTGTGSGATDLRSVGPDYNQGKPLPATAGVRKALRQQKQQRGMAAKATHDASVGDTRSWLALDDTTGKIYRKDYTLRGIGDHIQVWVAADTSFPAGDCRNDLGLTDITDDQVNAFVHEFDTNIYPKESASFSVPPSLDGSQAALAGPDGSTDYYQVSDSQADDIVTLVDNVRDANYYDPSTPDGQTYIAGFFYSTFNYYLDRNIMTIDAYDWLHRTGANPPDDSNDPAYLACAQSQGSNRGYGAAAPAPVRGHLRPRVPAPAGELPGRRRGELGQRGPLGLRPEPRGLRRHQPPADRPERRLPHRLLRGLHARVVRRSGELPHALG